MGEPTRLGVVGCGWAGMQAVLAGTKVPEARVVAVADVDAGRRESVAREFAVPRGYGDYRALLDDPEVDAVYLATSPSGRLPMVLDTLAAGKHVLVQKPHAVRAPEILAMDAAASESGTVLQFCYFMRHFPRNRQIRLAVARGKIGDPYHAHIFLKYNAVPALSDGSRWLCVYGQKGGALGQHASHELDMVWWWMGCPEPEWAFAVKHSPYAVYDGPEGPAEDYLSAIIGLAGNKTIQIDCSRMAHCDAPTVVELYGTTGAIRGGALSRFKDREFATEPIDEPVDVPYSQAPEPPPVFFYEVDHFVRAVRGEVEPDVSAKEAHRFMRMLDAIYDSALEGKKLPVA